MNSQQVRDKILNSSEPLIIKQTIKWNILNWSLEDWKNLLQNEEMEFRLGSYEPTKEPQWERYTDTIKGKFDFFLNQTQNDLKKWLYFDYKYLKTNLLNATELRNDITLARLGFPEATVDESTVWIGSKGAHTPCHIDTYGINLVCQLYGRKLWVLFPPEDNLRPTRVPYEESSIYSKLNFFSPVIEDFQGISNPYIITVEPGDVLYVPHGWWHYVENLETAISINVWLPSPEDDTERVKEALVQFLIKQISDLSQEETQQKILNPNMEEILKEDSKSVLDMIMTTINICESNKNRPFKKIKVDIEEKQDNQKYLNETLLDPNCIMGVCKSTQKEWRMFLENQTNRFDRTTQKRNQNFEEGTNETDKGNKIIKLINALTNPDVISLIQNKLLSNKD